MNARRGKAMPTASKAGAAAPKVSAPSATRGARAKPASMTLPSTKPTATKPVPMKPSECPIVPEAVQPNEQKCSTKTSGSQRKKSAGVPQERPQERVPRARTEKAPTEKAPLSQDNLEDGLKDLFEPLEPQVTPERLLSRAGSRLERGARSVRERKPPNGPMEAPEPLAPGPCPGPRVEAPGGWNPRAVLEKLRLRRQEISEAAEVVNKVMDYLLKRVQRCDSVFKGVEQLNTGSYYEQVKVSAPNEFDVMFKMDMPRIQLVEYRNSGAHYFVKFKRDPKGNPLSQFVEGEVLSASKMLTKFREIIKKEVKNIEGIDVTVERKKNGCPAVTLLIRKPKEISVDIILALEVKKKNSWPASTRHGLPIHNWLGRKVRKDIRLGPFCLVAKNAKEGNVFQEETWRLSFSHSEKYILKNHGKAKTCCEANGVKCCRKDCLKLMKYLLEQLKEKCDNKKKLDIFCSYHVKTAFLHVCTQNPHDTEWQCKDLRDCFDRYVEYFLQCLKTEQLTHYFIPGLNLFSRDKINKISKEFLSNLIEYERNNGFPVFL